VISAAELLRRAREKTAAAQKPCVYCGRGIDPEKLFHDPCREAHLKRVPAAGVSIFIKDSLVGGDVILSMNGGPKDPAVPVFKFADVLPFIKRGRDKEEARSVLRAMHQIGRTFPA
jgi:hypothetical protein